ncbi:TNT domain-containing protein [Streptomyces chartreusis]|uniref:TNT domain-containing protein n=1 Tax=Streptomyces chartreusis TaxID=1969 RepID=UPI002E182CE8
MRVLRVVAGGLLSLLLTAGIVPAAAQSADVAAVSVVDCPSTDRGRGTNSAPPPWQSWEKDDWRLGPAQLPRGGALGAMVQGYDRTGGTSASWFIECYWQTDPQTGKSGWWYPDNDGFVLENGEPVRYPLTLGVGQLVDLFGSGFGRFLSPAGTAYTQRSIPPSNLNTLVSDRPFGYHLYRVQQPITVQAGPVRPWFGQMGLGVQYVTPQRIPALVASGHLKEVPADLSGPGQSSRHWRATVCSMDTEALALRLRGTSVPSGAWPSATGKGCGRTMGPFEHRP